MPPKKPKYASSYKAEWSKKYVFIHPVEGDKTKVTCGWCKCQFSVSHGGINDVTSHMDTKKHRQNDKAINSSRSLASMFAVGGDSISKVSLYMWCKAA